MVSTPQISIGPAGSRINRDYARRGWAAETEGGPSLEEEEEEEEVPSSISAIL